MATLHGVGNASGKQTSREEEIAFLAMEQVLKVDIELADAGAGDRQPDGAWVYPDSGRRHAVVEITSPPATSLLASWAAAKREGRAQSESGSVDLRLGELAEVCTEILAEDWAKANLDKLLAKSADERHLFLLGRGHDVQHYFYRLSDSYDDGTAEHVDELSLPDGITDVWFRGRARRDPVEPLGAWELWLARFQRGVGWHRYVVTIEEQQLPAPNAGIADDPAPEGWREPKNRTINSISD